MTGADIYMKTCKEKALEWNVSPRSVNDMCKKGRIQGAIKEKESWLIPDDSPKPMDSRIFRVWMCAECLSMVGWR